MTLFFLYKSLGKFCILIVIPYILMMLFIIAYIVFCKYKLWVETKSVPLSTVLNIDLSKVKLNLKIKSVIYNFLLVLAVQEFITNVLWAVSRTNALTPSKYSISEFNALVENKHEDWVRKFVDLVPIRFKENSLFYFDYILLSILLPIICLFLIVLRRMFLNLPYGNWIIGYTVVILARTVFFLELMQQHDLYYLLEMILFPIGLIDFVVYTNCCKKFYLLLKGRREEARWHLTQNEYHRRQIIVKQFIYSQTYTFMIYLLLLILFLVALVRSLTVFVLNISTSHNSIPSQSHSIYISIQCRKSLEVIYILIDLTQVLVVILLEGLLALSYVMACIGIIWKLCRRRKKYNHVNDWVTKPLMERYRATLDKSSMNRGRDLLSIR